ncbi:radical SAM protein [Natranaerobius thermophilus]|uniref:Radical SAM domain protein n=1 Tax=Natranaerobius thermophilus (strain ATCC BAA-1301 / DSM 18059 / JW/NM-WN-LF) TaxID=457570 RepID=B2A0J3_NATTJ|nr:radical SAM protein [Natranaerobius thermophilus]ACB84554.1 Radical SAM domain protein [Natranaerobius thermophilus JW/NM-WN-LF]
MVISGTELGKRFLGEKIFRQVISYLEKDPLNNMNRGIDLILKAPIAEHHRQIIHNIKDYLENDPVTQKYIQRIFNNTNETFRKKGIVNFFLNATLMGVPKQLKESEKLGVSVPFAILIDPTSKCNLRCKGCWAGTYDHHDELDFETVDRLITEGKELGIYFIPLSGGEPFAWDPLLELCEKHDDVVFMPYTNGTLIDEQKVEKMAELGNISPAISIEGDRQLTDERRGKGVFDKVSSVMENLREAGVPFGFSVTLTRENCEQVISEEFIDMMIDKGALYGWSFHYIPIGREPDFSLMLTAEQRAQLVERVNSLRSSKPLKFADFWNDGHLSGGCIAGGRRYFHITAKGDIEPCAFIHFAVENIQDKSLKEILQTPIFKSYQKRQPFDENYLRPCPLIDVPDALREIVDETGATSTDSGSDTILTGKEAEEMDKVATSWKKAADEIASGRVSE